jgi:hypothetical protein
MGRGGAADLFQRPDDRRHRGGSAVPAPRRADRGELSWRRRLLRACRGPLARRRPRRFMPLLAMLEVDENGTSATWGEQVTDEA